MCVPHFARGFALPHFVATVDRRLYPEGDFPVGQWDYWLLHREHFGRTVDVFERDVRATFSASYRSGSPDAVGRPAKHAATRKLRNADVPHQAPSCRPRTLGG